MPGSKKVERRLKARQAAVPVQGPAKNTQGFNKPGSQNRNK